MIPYNGMMTPNRARNNGSDQEHTPVMFRQFVAASGVHDVQLKNGVGQISMLRVDSTATMPGFPKKTGYLYAVSQIIPTHQWKDAAGFHSMGPVFFLMIRRSPRSTLFPYATLSPKETSVLVAFVA